MTSKTNNSQRSSFFNFSANNIAIGLIILFTVFLIWGYITSGRDSQEIAVNDFLNNVSQNKYSRIEVRDDSTVVGYGKYLYVAEFEDGIELATKDRGQVRQLDLLDTTLTVDKLFEYTKKLGIRESVEAISKRGTTVRIADLYIFDDFILARNADRKKGDFLIKDFGIDSFKLELSKRGLQENALDANIHYAMYSAGVKSSEEIVAMQNNNLFGEVWVLDGLVIASVKDSEVVSEFFASQPDVQFYDLLEGAGVDTNLSNVYVTSVVIPRIPWGDIITLSILIGFGGIAVMMFRGIQGSGGSLMKFGQSKAKLIFGQKPDITFDDVAGVDEAKEDLREIVMFLKEPKMFLKRGARIPKGVLMVGSPGTGKTLLAKAIAGEAGVPFFHTSGSEFEEMLVGAGASRVRDLFEKAKKAAPSIIFIDEIDAVARKRGTTVQSGTTEQTLNQILVEMDGFEKNTNVIVIAATNRPDVLDTAILRPGRFDRRVVLDLPDAEGRKQIIKIHAANKVLAKDVDLDRLAKRTVGFSGADIENMLNEAAIIITKAGRDEITFEDLEEASNKVQIGPARKRKRTEEELKMTAYHEAGHALVMTLVPEHDPVHRVTIVSRGRALGYTMPLPEGDEVQITRTKMLSKIKSLVAGFATEELIYGDVTSGASNDIEKATELARRMVKNFGMSKKLGLIKYGQDDSGYLGYHYEEGRNYSEATAEIIDNEVRAIVDECYKEAVRLLKENRKTLDAIVDVLMEKEVIDADEFAKFFPERGKKK